MDETSVYLFVLRIISIAAIFGWAMAYVTTLRYFSFHGSHPFMTGMKFLALVATSMSVSMTYTAFTIAEVPSSGWVELSALYYRLGTLLMSAIVWWTGHRIFSEA